MKTGLNMAVPWVQLARGLALALLSAGCATAEGTLLAVTLQRDRRLQVRRADVQIDPGRR
jgi:hypothetical protein